MEENFDLVFDGLHIKHACLKVVGEWLQRSGWTAALEEANVALSGTAASFI